MTRTRRSRRSRPRQDAQHRLDVALGIGCSVLAAAILAFPFVWAAVWPASFRLFVWGM